MKKDRNCGCSGMQGGMPQGYGVGVPMMPNGPMPYLAPGMVIPTPGMQGGMPQGYGMGMQPNITNYNPVGTEVITENGANVSAMDQLQAQINNLDRRVSRLESQLQDTKSSTFNSNKYTDSNYHMM